MASDDIYKLQDMSGSMNLYKNNYTLSLGFMVPTFFNQAWKYELSNPFDVQNNLAYYGANVKDLFVPVQFQDDNTTATITVKENQYLYAYVSNKSIEQINVTMNGETKLYTGINHGRTVDIGYVLKGTTITIADAKNGGLGLQLYVSAMDKNKFNEVYKNLSDEQFQVTSYDDTHVKGTVNVEKAGMLFTTIPYDEGYSVYVDGKKTGYTSIANKAFMAIYLQDTGTHTVEFRYTARGLDKGLIISGFCILMLAGLIVFRIVFKKELTEPEAFSKAMEQIKQKKNNKKLIPAQADEEVTLPPSEVLDSEEEQK